MDPIASQVGSSSVFLRRHVATCDFPGGGRIPARPLDPPMCSPMSVYEAKYKELKTHATVYMRCCLLLFS